MLTCVLGVNTTCTADTLTVQILMEQPFQGLVYARGFPLECRVQGTGGTDVTLHLPATGCGVRVVPSKVSSLILQGAVQGIDKMGLITHITK